MLSFGMSTSKSPRIEKLWTLMSPEQSLTIEQAHLLCGRRIRFVISSISIPRLFGKKEEADIKDRENGFTETQQQEALLL